ncbi:peptidoglycan DD-metalloendopeptidase family protein [Teredinibacter haidensis]|uniref:peptidoglycan DD-metalloendopeptidase family protein n=1 Tax=Teredinibacter haidensis TaxID=2731755 RepID=UPI000948EEA2|nr:peptidoglycan DD-metalloendopeptidase family protein [Teredinibacter haidensis]
MIKILITLLFVIAINSSCSNTSYRANVADRPAPPGEKLTFHIVAKGETLYSIAWRYNLDYKLLARANGVASSYNIYPGQKLSLNTKPAVYKPTVKKAPAGAKLPTPQVSKENTAPPRSIKKSPTMAKQPAKSPSKNPQKWQWPAKGKVIATFSSNSGLNKGIDIQGKLGEPVHTAAAGIVVYSGSGLRGYGKLLIVKHSDKYLSAYAHNKRLLVKEGSQVKVGDKIAEMGSSGTDTVKLHFEIRYDGNPVDPLRFLPRK